MNDSGKVALQMLRSNDFFIQLRNTMTMAGLAKQENVGVAVFFVSLSRFRPNPLRLTLQEKTEGNAKYVVNKVSQFLDVGDKCNVFSEHGWSRFVEGPDRKVAFVPDWTGHSHGMSAQVDGNRFIRLEQIRKNGLIAEKPQQIVGHFACISSIPRIENSSVGRWLTIEMPKAPWDIPDSPESLDEKIISPCFEVQRLFRERAKKPVVLPDWADVFVNRACQRENSYWHLPAFLEAWKITCLIRSFLEEDSWERAARRGHYVATLDDLTAAGALLKGLFREGQFFPSVQTVVAEAFPKAEKFYAVNPLTMKGRCARLNRSEPIKYKSLLEDWHS